MGVSLKTEQRGSHTTLSSFRPWVRRAEGYRGTRDGIPSGQAPVKPWSPLAPPKAGKPRRLPVPARQTGPPSLPCVLLQSLSEHRPRGVVSLESQPFPRGHESAPKTQWVMAVAHWYRLSDRFEGLRLLRRRFGSKGAVGGRSPFPVADSKETTPPGRCSKRRWFPDHSSFFRFDRDPHGLSHPFQKATVW